MGTYVAILSQVIAHSRPDQFGVLWRSRDEFYLLLESVLQWCFLREYGTCIAINIFV